MDLSLSSDEDLSPLDEKVGVSSPREALENSQLITSEIKIKPCRDVANEHGIVDRGEVKRLLDELCRLKTSKIKTNVEKERIYEIEENVMVQFSKAGREGVFEQISLGFLRLWEMLDTRSKVFRPFLRETRERVTRHRPKPLSVCIRAISES